MRCAQILASVSIPTPETTEASAPGGTNGPGSTVPDSQTILIAFKPEKIARRETHEGVIIAKSKPSRSPAKP
jgi:hypothetical protein